MAHPVSDPDSEDEGFSGRHAVAVTVVILVVALALGYWLTLPPVRPALNEACEPEDVAARLSAWLYGPAFWQKQQAALAGEVETLQDLRNAARGNAGRPLDMTPIEMRMRRLSDRDMQALAAGNEQAWRAEILFVGRCEEAVKQRLAR